jgi:hypothetical protein
MPVVLAGMFCCLVCGWHHNVLAFDAQTENSNEEQKVLLADRLHQGVSNRVLNSAERIDAFFYDEQTAIEQNKTTFRIKLDTFFEEGEPVDFRPRTSLKLVLPGLEEKFHFTLSGDPEDDDKLFDTPIDTPDPGDKENDDDGVKANLRYFFKNELESNISASIGARIRDGRFVIFPEGRYRRSFEFDPIALRFEQRVIWYSDTGWESKTKFDFDNLVFQKYLLRTTLSGDWFEEKDGYFYSFGFATFQPLFKNIMLNYSWKNSYETRPVHSLTESVFKAAYRQNIWREWLFFEVVPQLSFPRERDFEAVPGILLRVEGIFGYISK